MDYSFDSCSDIINNMNDLQLFVMSGACPDNAKSSLHEEQLHLIETLNMKLMLLKDSLSTETVITQGLKIA